MSDSETDALVIGAGPGGYVAAIRAGQLGCDVTLVEKEAYGGVCLNHGCIPSKALISATDLAERAGSAAEMGVDAEVSTDLGRMVEWKEGIVDQLTGGVEQLCRANGVELVEGRAGFVDPTTVRVDGGADAPDRIDFETAIVATGSRPIQLPGFDFGDWPVWSSRDALSAETVPDRLLVVGAGYIGMELSTVYAKLGSEVTVVEALDDVLPGYEDDVAAVVRDRAAELGISFNFGEAADGWTETDDGIRVTTETDDGETPAYDADRVLVAVGREPVTDTLGLANAGLETDADGFLPTDRQGRTAVDHIHAIGDVAGEPMLAHAASKEGIVAAHAAAGDPIDVGDWIVPAAVFTDPEIGTVGMTADEAAEVGFDPVVGEMPFAASGRALTTGEADGFVRVVAAEDGALLGAQVVGPEASELVAELAFAIRQRATLSDLAETIHVHPTLSEAVMEAAENALGQAIHTTN
ncbi:dihydrolipoyl dehydrogenase [Halobacteriales archaeon QS_1_68_17]|nr:MAG: dihydrolipoyl dehydrogenase [Halobacteriales archaeon QS_1_68_17]